ALLAELTRAHMLTQRGHGRFALHDLLCAYAHELAGARDAACDRQAAVRRVLDHYLHTAYRADQLLRRDREDAIVLAPTATGVAPQRLADHKKALAWFNAEHEALLAAVRQAAETGFD